MIDELGPVDYSDNLLTHFSYSSIDTVYGQHDDGYGVRLKVNGSSTTTAIERAPKNPGGRGVWKAKLYAAMGVKLQPGTSYRVQFDLESEGDQADYEICFGGDSENAYGAVCGRSLTAGGVDHIEHFFTPKEGHGPLAMRLQLGNINDASGNKVTVSNIKIAPSRWQISCTQTDRTARA